VDDKTKSVEELVLLVEDGSYNHKMMAGAVEKARTLIPVETVTDGDSRWLPERSAALRRSQPVSAAGTNLPTRIW
jgi:hypothetical protein